MSLGGNARLVAGFLGGPMTHFSADDAPRPLGSGYLLESQLGGGAMGQVWKGSTRQGEPVAIKVLRSELSSDPAFVARFLQEAQILTGLHDEHLVQVRDLVAESGSLAIVMDLVPGPDLRAELAQRGTFQPHAAVQLIDGVLAGLTAVHAAGVVHRDVKPENVLLHHAEDGSIAPRLTDFGVARIVEQGSRSTTVIGTPEYIAPEIADGASPVPASDLYSAGIVLYELLTGVTPFTGGSPLAVMRRHVEQQPGRPDGIPDSLWAAITALLEKNPARRPKDAAAARDLLAAAGPAIAGLAALPKLTEPPTFVPVTHQTVIGTRGGLEQPDYAAAAATADPSHRKRNVLIATAAVVALAVAGTAVALAVGGGKSPAPLAAAAASSSVTTSAAPSDTASTSASASPSTSTSTSPSGAATGVPSVVGLSLDQATTAIQNAGLQVVTKQVLDNTKPDNTVVAQTPAGGAPATTGTVTLTVARQSVGTFLADMTPVANGGYGVQTDSVTMNGTPYAHAVSMPLGTCSTQVSAQYDLGRHYRTLTAKVGLADSSDNTATVLFDVVVDGRKVYSKSTVLGKPLPLTIDVTGVLRLEIDATLTNNTQQNCLNNSSTAVWADADVLGVPDEVPTPTDSTTPTDGASPTSS